MAWSNYGTISIKQWNGNSWMDLGSLSLSSYYTLAMTTDSNGNPVIASAIYNYNNGNSSYKIYVKRWNGASWLDAVKAPLVINNYIYDLKIAIDSNGMPIVTWANYNNTSNPYSIYVKRWVQ